MAVPHVSNIQTGAILVIGGVGNDGGGFAILPSGRIIKIPPWDPNIRDTLREMNDLATLTDVAAHLDDPRATEEITRIVTPMIERKTERIRAQLADVLPERVFEEVVR